MLITLYIFGKQPMSFTSTTNYGDVTGGRIVPKIHKVAQHLGVRPSLVDLVGIGHGYCVFAVFDHDGRLNTAAITELTRLTGIELDHENEADQIHGPVLTLTLVD